MLQITAPSEPASLFEQQTTHVWWSIASRWRQDHLLLIAVWKWMEWWMSHCSVAVQVLFVSHEHDEWVSIKTWWSIPERYRPGEWVQQLGLEPGMIVRLCVRYVCVCLWVCTSERERERQRRDWNLTPLSLASGQQEKRMGWVRICCWSCCSVFPYNPSLNYTQPQLFSPCCCLHACYWLTVTKHTNHPPPPTSNCQNSCHHRSLHMRRHRTGVYCRCTPLEGFAANWQFSIASLLTCPVTQPVTMEMSSASLCLML